MKSTARIEKLIEEYDRRLTIASYVRPRWVTLIVDPGKRETTEGVIAAHIREHPTDAGCNFIAHVLCDGGYAVG
jgi:hypothetical protein